MIIPTVILTLQILMLELNDEAAEQTVEAKVVDLLQGQEGFRWKVKNRTDYSLCLFMFLQRHAAAVDIMKDGAGHCNVCFRPCIVKLFFKMSSVNFL